MSFATAGFSARSFHGNTAGAVAVTVALLGVALALAAGIGIDMGRIYLARATAQESVDQAVIAAAAVAYADAGAVPPNEAKMKEVVTAYLASSSFGGSQLAQLAEPSVSYQTEPEDKVTVSVAVKVETTFLRIANIEEINLTVSSTAKRPESDIASLDLETRDGPVEVALVVDNSDMMNRDFGDTTKAGALRGAATNLVERVLADDGARAGIVPFGTWLSVERRHWTEPWLDLSRLPVSDTGNCENGGADCGPSPSETGFSGCFMTRTSSPDTIDNPTEPPYPAKAGECPQVAMLDLTGEESDPGGRALTLLSGRIAELGQSEGAETDGVYIPGGLEFGWHMLTAGEPLDRASPPGKARTLGVRKNLVLVAGGANTVFPSADGGWRNFFRGLAEREEQTPAADADLTTRNFCSRINDAGIVIHVVAMAIDDRKTLDILRECAGSRGSFYLVNNPADLDRAFVQIGNRLTRSRLTN